MTVVEELPLALFVVLIEDRVEDSEQMGRLLKVADGLVVLDLPGQELESPKTDLMGDVLVEDYFFVVGFDEIVIALDLPSQESLELVDGGSGLHLGVDQPEDPDQFLEPVVNQALGFPDLPFFNSLQFKSLHEEELVFS